MDENIQTASESGVGLSGLLGDLFSPDCRLGIEELKSIGVAIDMNQGRKWRLVGLPSGEFRGQPRTYFPTWLNELLFAVEKKAIENTKARMRHELGL